MVKHIVLFKLKDEAPADKKLTAMKEFKAAIEALPAKISVIRKIEVVCYSSRACGSRQADC